jgi:hypothetical protein
MNQEPTVNVTTGIIRPGEYVAAVGDHMVGRILTGHWHGFRAVTLDGTELDRWFDTLDAAGEVLALEFVLHYGEKVGA